MAMNYIMTGVAFAVEAINMTMFFSEEGCQVAGLGMGSAVTDGNWNLAWNILHGPLSGNMEMLGGVGFTYALAIQPTWINFMMYWLVMHAYRAFWKDYIAEQAEGGEGQEGVGDDNDFSMRCREKTVNGVKRGESLSTIKSNMQQDPDCERFLNAYYKREGTGGALGFWEEVGRYVESQEVEDEVKLNQLFYEFYNKSPVMYNRLYMGNKSNISRIGASKSDYNKMVTKVWHSLNYLQKRAYANLPEGKKMNGWTHFYNLYFDSEFDFAKNWERPAFGFKQIGNGEISPERSYEMVKNKHISKITEKGIIIGSIKYKDMGSNLKPVALIENETGFIYILEDLVGEARLQFQSNILKLSDHLIGTNLKKGTVLQSIYFPITERSTQLVVNGAYAELLEANLRTGTVHVRYPNDFESGGRLFWKEYEPVPKVECQMWRTSDHQKTGLFYGTTNGTILMSATIEDGERYIKYLHKTHGTLEKEPENPYQTCKTEYINIQNFTPHEEEDTWFY